MVFSCNGTLFSNKKEFRASEMAQQVKMPAVKPYNLSLTPGTHIVGEPTLESYKLSSNHSHVHVQTHKHIPHAFL